MKYLKKFEDVEEYKPKNYYGKHYYWLVPTDDRFEDSMRKIGCPQPYIRTKLYLDFLKDLKYIFISYNGYESGLRNDNDTSRWGWNKFRNSEIPNNFYEKNGFTFAGYINISEYELEANKYNL